MDIHGKFHVSVSVPFLHSKNILSFTSEEITSGKLNGVSFTSISFCFLQLQALRTSYKQLKDSTDEIESRNSKFITEQHKKRMDEFQAEIRFGN